MIAACTGTAIPAQAGSGVAVPLTLRTVPKAVHERNPHLAAARHRIEEARGRLDQSGRLPNPKLDAEYRKNTENEENAFEVELSQTFPLTARLRLEKDVSRVAVEVAENELRNVERKLVAKASDAAARWLAVQEQVRLRGRQAEVATELARFTETVSQRGEGSVLDAGEARLESRQLELDIRRLEASATVILGELKPLLGLAPGDRLSLSGGLPVPGVPSSGSSVDPGRRPDYQAALLTIDAASREIELERARRFEDVTVGIIGESAREEDIPAGFQNDNFIGIRLSIPLPIWNRNQGAIREKIASEQRVRGEADALANEIRNEFAAALQEMRAQVELLRSIDGDLLPLAEKQLERSDAAYRNGQTDLQVVLRARDQAIKLETARLEALRDFHLARIRFEAAAGLNLFSPATK